MNKSLLAFAFILIVGGIYTGIALIAVLGVFLLIPALLTTPKPPSKVPVSKSLPPQPRRISPPPVSKPSPPARMDYAQAGSMQPPPPVQGPPAMYTPATVAPMSTGQIYSPALFPASMFPSLSTPAAYAQQVPEHKEGKASEKDELLELGVLVAVLKLAFG